MTSPVLPNSPAYRRITLQLAQALERQHERLAHGDDDEPQIKTRCARNYRGLPDDALHICTGGKFCKGNCKPTRGTLAEYKSRKAVKA